MNKIGLLLGIAFCGLSVILGAFGAHALTLKEKYISVYDKAVLYQMFHALGILIVCILDKVYSQMELDIVIWVFVFGIILFSGSLYLLAITEIKWLGAITPIGGTLFIVGWIMLLFKIINLTS